MYAMIFFCVIYLPFHPYVLPYVGQPQKTQVKYNELNTKAQNRTHFILILTAGFVYLKHKKAITWTSYSPPPPGFPSPFTSYCKGGEEYFTFSYLSTIWALKQQKHAHLFKHGVVFFISQPVCFDPALRQIRSELLGLFRRQFGQTWKETLLFYMNTLKTFGLISFYGWWMFLCGFFCVYFFTKM